MMPNPSFRTQSLNEIADARSELFQEDKKRAVVRMRVVASPHLGQQVI